MIAARSNPRVAVTQNRSAGFLPNRRLARERYVKKRGEKLCQLAVGQAAASGRADIPIRSAESAAQEVEAVEEVADQRRRIFMPVARHLRDDNQLQARPPLSRGKRNVYRH